jgi:hypothetical protein
MAPGIVARGLLGRFSLPCPSPWPRRSDSGRALRRRGGSLRSRTARWRPRPDHPDQAEPRRRRLASRGDSDAADGGARGDGGGGGSPVGGGDTGGGSATGGGGSGGSGDDAPAISIPEVPDVEPPGGGGSTGDTVNGVVDGVGNTVNGLLGQ